MTVPIEITDPDILQPFSPWGDAFFDKQRGILTEPPKTDNVYQVLLSLESHVLYAFNYIPGSPGIIYLPDEGDEWYETNISTIIRSGGLEGQWLYASREWDDLIGGLLENQEIADISYIETSDGDRTEDMETASPSTSLSSHTRIRYISF